MKKIFVPLLAAALGFVVHDAGAFIVSFSSTGTTLIDTAPQISLTYNSAPLGAANSASPIGLCSRVAAGQEGGGVFNFAVACAGVNSSYDPPLDTITTSPQTELQNYTPGNVDAMVAAVGHGGQAWLIRSFFDAETGAQSVVLPVRVYTSAALPIVAGGETQTLPAGSGNINIGANDSIGGAATNDFNATYSIVDAGGLNGLGLVSGVLVVPGGQSGGTHNVTYRVCQAVTMTGNCANAVAVVVLPNQVVAGNDSASLGATGGTVNILANDTVGGAAANAATNADVSLVSNGGIAGASINAAGQLVIPAGVASGSYTVSYRLCEKGTTNCAAATVAIGIAATVFAANDTAALTAQGGVVNILANDTISGQPATPANADVSLTGNGGASGAALNAQGQLVIPSGLAAGTYNVGYRLCAKGTSTCATAVAAVTIRVTAAALSIVKDRATIPPTGGSLNVLANDTIDGRTPAPGELVLSLVSNGNIPNLTLGADGTLIVPGGLGGGAYQPSYRACQRQAPANCGEAVVYLAVVAGVTGTLPNHPPSVPGGPSGGGTVTLIGAGGAPITFTTNPTPTTAGAVNDPLTFSDVKLVFGDNETGPVQAFYGRSDPFDAAVLLGLGHAARTLGGDLSRGSAAQ